MKKIKVKKMINIQGGMSCHQLANQLDVMWSMGGNVAAQADAIMYLIADGYTLCG